MISLRLHHVPFDRKDKDVIGLMALFGDLTSDFGAQNFW